MVTKKKLTKEEWEAMTGTDMSLILPSDGSIETARESSLNDIGKEKSEGTVEQTDTTSENLQPSTGKEEAVPTSQRRIRRMILNRNILRSGEKVMCLPDFARK